MKYLWGAAAPTREGVYHARLRRLGTEGRWNKAHRSFGSMGFVPPILKKRIEIEIVS